MFVIVINTNNAGEGESTFIVGEFKNSSDAESMIRRYVESHPDLEIVSDQLDDVEPALDCKDQQDGSVCFYIRPTGGYKRIDQCLTYDES